MLPRGVLVREKGARLRSSGELSSELLSEVFVNFFVIPILLPQLLICCWNLTSHLHVGTMRLRVEVGLELLEIIIFLQKLVHFLLLLLVVDDGLSHFTFGVFFVVAWYSQTILRFLRHFDCFLVNKIIKLSNSHSFFNLFLFKLNLIITKLTARLGELWLWTTSRRSKISKIKFLKLKRTLFIVHVRVRVKDRKLIDLIVEKGL